jgi:hypothetical protein
MNRNTLLGLRQIMDAIDEEGTDFLRDMSRDEKFAFHDLVRACDGFVKQAEVLWMTSNRSRVIQTAKKQ